MCDEVVLRNEFNDCTLVLGKSGLHSEISWEMMPHSMHHHCLWIVLILRIRIRNGTLRTYGIMNIRQGLRSSTLGQFLFLGPEAFDRVLAERLSENIIYEMGEWKTHEEVNNERGIYIPLDIASAAGAEVGDNLDTLTFTYTYERSLPGAMEDEDCPR